MNKISTNLSLISFNDIDEEREMHSKSDNIEIMVYDKADEVWEKLFESLLKRYQTVLETSMRGSDFMSY